MSGIGSATAQFKPPSEYTTTLLRCESLSVSHPSHRSPVSYVLQASVHSPRTISRGGTPWFRLHVDSSRRMHSLHEDQQGLGSENTERFSLVSDKPIREGTMRISLLASAGSYPLAIHTRRCSQGRTVGVASRYSGGGTAAVAVMSTLLAGIVGPIGVPCVPGGLSDGSKRRFQL